MKVYLSILSLFILFQLNSQVVFETSISDVFKKAKSEKKLVFVEYYNSNCPVCKKLEPLFEDPKLADFYNKYFINYKLNTSEITEDEELFMEETKLTFESVPFFLFFDSNKKFIHYSTTKPDVEFLIQIAKTALNEKERTGALEEKYNKGDRTIKTLYAYANLLALYKSDSLRKIVANDLFDAFPKSDLGNKKSYIITKQCVDYIDNGFFQFWMENMDKLKGMETGHREGNEKKELSRIVLHSIYSKDAENWNLSQIRNVKEMVIKTELSEFPDVYFWQKESVLRYQLKDIDTCLIIFNNMLLKDSVNNMGQFYTIEFYLTLVQSKKEVELLKNNIIEINNKITEEDDFLMIYYIWIIYYDKINDIDKTNEFINQYYSLTKGKEPVNANHMHKIQEIDVRINR